MRWENEAFLFSSRLLLAGVAGTVAGSGAGTVTGTLRTGTGAGTGVWCTGAGTVFCSTKGSPSHFSVLYGYGSSNDCDRFGRLERLELTSRS